MKLIEYIKEIENIARSQVGVHFGEKSPYHIREILRICEAAQQERAADVCHDVTDGRHLWQNDEVGRYCIACGTRR